jgi:hypothetical protein
MIAFVSRARCIKSGMLGQPPEVYEVDMRGFEKDQCLFLRFRCDERFKMRLFLLAC